MMRAITFNNLFLSVPNPVYEPAEDSFLLANYASGLRGSILDVGTGSGIQALVNAKANPENEVIGVDIHPEAVRCATQNAKTNKIPNARFFVSDLFVNINGKFDGIVFNPPYLPNCVSGFRCSVSGNELALSGGKTGRELTDRFLDQFQRYLNKNGSVLLLQSSLNNVEKTKQMLSEKGYNTKILAQESFFFEKLHVLKIRKA
jgi:release factor glutamine methyltransferase